MERYSVGVCLPSIWNSKCPRVFTKILKPAIGLLRKQGVRLIIYLDDFLLMASTEKTLSYHVTLMLTLLKMLGFVVNYQKSQLNPSQSIEFLGFRINSITHQPSIGQSKEYQTRVSEGSGESRYHDKRPSSVVRETKCLDPSSIPGTPPLLSHTSSQETQSSSAWGLRVPSVLDCGSPRRTKMVERPPFCLERESSFTKPSSTDNRDRCLHNGLGSKLWKFPDQRPLVSVRKAVTHKLFRTSSRWICPEVISKKQVQYPCKTNDGQYNSNKLYKQNGWANIIGPVKPSLRPLAMVSRTLYNSRRTPLAGAVKHSG